MRFVFRILISLLVGFAVLSSYYHWLVPKTTQVNFNLTAEEVDSVKVSYNLNGSWEERHSISQAYNKEPNSPMNFAYSWHNLPTQIRIEASKKADTIRFENVVISNSYGNQFTPFQTFFHINDLSMIIFPDSTSMTYAAYDGNPYAVFNLPIHESIGHKFETLNWVSWSISIAIAILVFLLLGRLLPHKISLNHGLIGIFIIVVFSAVVNLLTGTIPQPINEENRMLNPKPHSWGSFVFMQELEHYLNDNFALRAKLAFWDSYTKYKLFGVSSQPNKVVINTDDHMFPVGMKSMDDFRHLVHFTEPEMENIRVLLEERRDWLKMKGIPYLITIFPNKHVAMQKSMPKEIIPGQIDSRLQRLMVYLKANSDIPIIDFTDYVDNKVETNERCIYYKHDTHWNNLGGFYGYQAIMNEVSKIYPDLKPNTLNDFDTSTTFYNNGDLAKNMLLKDLLLKQEVEFDAKFPNEKDLTLFMTHKRTINMQVINKNRNRNLLMFRDSYSTNMIDFISNNFGESVFVWDHCFDAKLVNDLKPDIVVHELAELFLTQLPCPNPPELADDLRKNKVQ